MPRVFIAYAEEDVRTAVAVASALEGRGFPVWYYERDAAAGVSYLRQTGEAIASCQAFILLISRRSLNSHQITKEVVRAHEENKPIVPVLIDVTDAEYKATQPEWREAIGAAASVNTKQGLPQTIDAIIRGLVLLGVSRGPTAKEEDAIAAAQPPSAASGALSQPDRPSPRRRRGRWRNVWSATAIFGILIAGLIGVIPWKSQHAATRKPRVRVLIQTTVRTLDYEIQGSASRGTEYEYTGEIRISPRGNKYYVVRLGGKASPQALVLADESELIGGDPASQKPSP